MKVKLILADHEPNKEFGNVSGCQYSTAYIETNENTLFHTETTRLNQEKRTWDNLKTSIEPENS